MKLKCLFQMSQMLARAGQGSCVHASYRLTGPGISTRSVTYAASPVALQPYASAHARRHASVRSYGNYQGNINEQGGAAEGNLPFPRTPYNKEFSNKAMITGKLTSDVTVEGENLPSGPIGRSSLAVNNKNMQCAEWYTLEFAGPGMAQAAAARLCKGDFVHVQGRLRQDRFNENKEVALVIEVQHVLQQKQEGWAFSRPARPAASAPAAPAASAQTQRQQPLASSQLPPSEARPPYQRLDYGSGAPARDRYQQQQQQPSGSFGGAVGAAADVEQAWQELFRDPSAFWDNRLSKKNPKAPDFKHKHKPVVLWVDSRNTPTWVMEELSQLPEPPAPWS